MKNSKGISLIALIITIAVLIIIATITIQKGMQRTGEATIAKHNQNISTTQEEVESYYYYKGAELPLVNLTPYPITAGSSLEKEVIKNGEQNDTFYTVDLSKLGKVAGKEGTTGGNDVYIVSSVRHTVYYAKGDTVKGITYHGMVTKNHVKLAQIVTPTAGPGGYAYNNPIIPAGFTHVGTETWDNGFTIQDANGSQFVWVPVLDPRVQANGTLDGTNFNSKFGRRTFGGGIDVEPNDTTYQNIVSSVNKYGGFYFGKYESSINGGKVEIKGNVSPWVNMNWATAQSKSESMDSDWGWDISKVESYACYGSHWDTVLQWFVDSGCKTLNEVKVTGNTWGNYYDDSFTGTTGITNTGAWIQTNAKGIYDMAGNVSEWTMENAPAIPFQILRGATFGSYGDTWSAAYRGGVNPIGANPNVGVRVVLHIK